MQGLSQSDLGCKSIRPVGGAKPGLPNCTLEEAGKRNVCAMCQKPLVLGFSLGFRQAGWWEEIVTE